MRFRSKSIDVRAAERDTGAIADRIHGAAIRLLRFVRREDIAAGLSAPQLSALSVLVFGGAQPISTLAAAEQVRAPTMSRLVDDLERLGLVERAAQPGDRRVNLVRVTKAGRTLLEEGRRKRLARLIALLAATNPAERRALHSAALTLMRLTDSGLVTRVGTDRSPASGKIARQRRLTGPRRRKG